MDLPQPLGPTMRNEFASGERERHRIEVRGCGLPDRSGGGKVFADQRSTDARQRARLQSRSRIAEASVYHLMTSFLPDEDAVTHFEEQRS